MTGNILKMKTIIPPLGKNILNRSEIFTDLNNDLFTDGGFTRQLTLVSAPAGFGKTTLARSWITQSANNTAWSWYSLDSEDNDFNRFWTYAIYALQRINNSFGKGPMGVLRSSEKMNDDINIESILVPLLNDLLLMEDPIFLVFDDYHLIDNTQIHKSMGYFIENLPPSIHVIITTRSDPPWSLYKWRGNGKMKEIRLKDLKFTEAEANQLLQNIKGVTLKDNHLHTLYKKTEGWVTGLNLVASTLTSTMDLDDFFDSFAGSNRHILHFLSEEVFTKLPNNIQEFLLQTSILNRFCAPLCNAVTGGDNGEDILAFLERENIFVIPLDDEGTWYRYHHLFSDILFLMFKSKCPNQDIICKLHEKACHWFLDAGEMGEALRHALSIDDLDKVATLLHRNSESLFHIDEPFQFVSFIESLPLDLLKSYPRLIAYKIFSFLLLKGNEDVEKYLEIADTLQYDDPQEQREYKGILEAIRTYYYININKFAESEISSQKALEFLPKNNLFWRMGISIFCGDTRFFSGNPLESYPYYYEIHRSNLELGKDYFTISTGIKVAINLYCLGKLKESEDTATRMLNLAKKEGYFRLSKIGIYWALLGDLNCEKGNLDEAERCVERSLYISKDDKPYLAWNYLSKISLCYAKNDYHDALHFVKVIEELHKEVAVSLYILYMASIWKARIYLKLDRVTEAMNILETLNISRECQAFDGKEDGYFVLAKALCLKNMGNYDTVNKLLTNLSEHYEKKGLRKLMLELLIVRSIFEEIYGNKSSAENFLFLALEIGYESHFYQVFLDEGKEILSVLERLKGKVKTKSRDTQLIEYIQKIYLNLNPNVDNVLDEASFNSHGESSTIKENDLIEELSPREMDILRLIIQGLSNQEIAKTLFLSLGTVKWHTSNIYGKLGVKSRTQAIVLANEIYSPSILNN